MFIECKWSLRLSQSFFFIWNKRFFKFYSALQFSKVSHTWFHIIPQSPFLFSPRPAPILPLPPSLSPPVTTSLFPILFTLILDHSLLLNLFIYSKLKLFWFQGELLRPFIEHIYAAKAALQCLRLVGLVEVNETYKNTHRLRYTCSCCPLGI